MSGNPSKVERILDLSSLVFLGLVAGIIVGQVFPPNRALHVRPEAFVKANQGILATSFPEANWGKAKYSLLFYLRSSCGYCQKSAAFHRKLAAVVSAHGIRPVALFPESAGIARATLKMEDIGIHDVFEGNAAMAGLYGTPALALVDAEGTIVKSWQGLLSADGESDVTRKINEVAGSQIEATRSEDRRNDTLEIRRISGEEFRVHQEDRGTKFIVVDIRSREAFRKEHIVNSINIPLNELEVRSSHEIPSASPIAVFCQYQSQCETSYANKGVFTNCTLGTMLLQSIGYDAGLLEEDSHSLAAAGVKFVR